MARRFIATLAADVVGFDRLKANDSATAFIISRDFYQAFVRHLDRHHGTRLALVLEASHLAQFSSALEALSCAVGLQRDLSGRSRSEPAWRQAPVRIGVNDNDQSSGAQDYHAARLLTLADAGGICMSRSVYDQVRSQLDQHDGTESDPKHSALLCRDIRRIWDELTPLDSPLVKISAAALTGRPRPSRSTNVPCHEDNSLVHKIKAFLDRIRS
jgi:adenylate cyclase